MSSVSLLLSLSAVGGCASGSFFTVGTILHTGQCVAASLACPSGGQAVPPSLAVTASVPRHCQHVSLQGGRDLPHFRATMWQEPLTLPRLRDRCLVDLPTALARPSSLRPRSQAEAEAGFSQQVLCASLEVS